MDSENGIKEPLIEWNEGAVYALGLYKQAATLLGIWPTETRATSGIKVGIYIIFHFISLSILFKKYIEHGLCGTVIETVDTGTICLSSVQIAFKVYIAWIQHDKFSRIINSAIQDWYNVVDEQSVKIMMKYAHAGRILLFFLLLTCVMAASPVVFSSLPGSVELGNDFDNESTSFRNIPIAPRCWMSVTSNPYHYYAYWTSVAIFAFSMGFGTACTNLFLYGFGLHLYAQFEILYISVNDIEGTEDYAQQRTFIRKFSKRHAQLLDLINDLENGGNLIVLSEVLAIIIITSIAGVMLLIAIPIGDGEIISNMGFRVTLVIPYVFIWNYMGEKLSSQNEKVQNAIYNCPWYKFPCRTAHDLQLIIMRSSYPFHLTAGKLATLNLMSFKETVKTMFSILSVFRLMLK